MDEDDGILMTQEPTDWFSAARRVVDRSMRSVGYWFIAMAAAVLMFAAAVGGLLSTTLAVASGVLAFLVGSFGLAGVCLFPVRVWEEQLASKNRARLEEVQTAIARIGGSGAEEVEPTLGDRLEQVLNAQRLGLGMAAVLEVLVVFVALAFAQKVEADASALPTFLWVVGIIPALVCVMLGKEVWRKDPTTMASARAERRLREAVKSKEELVGGLVLDEHARQVGGELTVQQDAGGLAVHSEVVLNLEAVEESVDHAAGVESVVAKS